MTDFFTALHAEPEWIFIGLGCMLLTFELLGAGGYALWSGTSAVLVGLLAWLIPFSWLILWLLFAILTLLSAYVWWLWIKKNNQKKPQKTRLNQPQKDLIGINTIVVEPILNGFGRVKINDGTWSAKCDEDLAKGTKVQVIYVDGTMLTVKKVS